MGRRGGRKLKLDELTSEGFARAVKDDPLVVLPIGATEEHGAHLPLGTDSFECEDIAAGIAEEFNALVLPPIRYGDCRSTRNFPGTISLRPETVTSLVSDVLDELVRNGISKVVVLSGHAGSGHMAAIKLATQRAVERNSTLKAMVLSEYDIAYDLAGEEFPPDDGHAGQIETSRMLAIRPDLIGDARPVGDTRPPRYLVVSDPERYFPTGVMGDSRDATEEKGRRIGDYVLTKLADIISEGFNIPRKNDRTDG